MSAKRQDTSTILHYLKYFVFVTLILLKTKINQFIQLIITAQQVFFEDSKSRSKERNKFNLSSKYKVYAVCSTNKKNWRLNDIQMKELSQLLVLISLQDKVTFKYTHEWFFSSSKRSTRSNISISVAQFSVPLSI